MTAERPRRGAKPERPGAARAPLRRRSPVAGIAAGLAAAVAATGAVAEESGLCDMKVYDSSRGAVAGEAQPTFKSLDQFVVCFRSTADGYVTLWDRMPTDAAVERLVPNANYIDKDAVAAPVTAGEKTCFGTGADGYYLQMDPKDGDGLGLMWLVFTEDADTHPLESSFSSSSQFAASYDRFGAGAIETDRQGADNAGSIPSGIGGACAPKKSLSYSYVVEPR